MCSTAADWDSFYNCDIRGIHLPWTTTQLSFSERLLAVNEYIQQPVYLLHIIALLLQQCHELVLCPHAWL